MSKLRAAAIENDDFSNDPEQEQDPGIYISIPGCTIKKQAKSVKAGKFWYYKKAKPVKDTKSTDKESNTTDIVSDKDTDKAVLAIDMASIRAFFNDNYMSIDKQLYKKIKPLLIKPTDIDGVRADLIDEARNHNNSPDLNLDQIDYGVGLIQESRTIESMYLPKLHVDLPRFSFDKNSGYYIESYRDDKDNCYIPYKNGLLQVTKDACTTIAYDDLEKYLVIQPSKTTMTRNFHIEDATSVLNSDFSKFLQNVSLKGTDKETTNEYFNATKRMLGYLIHSYKDEGKAKAVLTIDKIAHENRQNGRAGKSLFGKAISHIRETFRFDAKKYNLDNRFIFQEIARTTKVVFLDDFKEGYSLSTFNNMITEDFTVELKGLKSYTLPFEESPKLAFAANFLPNDFDNPSVKARFFVHMTDNYYSSEYEPEMEFKKRFFGSEWTSYDWSLFDNLMVNCTQLYLKDKTVMSKELANNPQEPIARVNKLALETSREFVRTILQTDNDDNFMFLNKPFKMSDFVTAYISEKGIKYIPESGLNKSLGIKLNTFCKFTGTEKRISKKQSVGKRETYTEIKGDFDWKALRAVLDEV